jgi:L-methionine (R)-S-oxide reductase
MNHNVTTDWKPLLESILQEHHCQTGTIHQTETDGAHLALICQIGVPDSLIEKISRIPMGKGIAGAAAEKREPVTLCNLQQDLGGVAKPDARKTGVAGSLAVPIFNADGTVVLGTLGVGMHAPHDFSDEQIRSLQSQAAAIGRMFEAR